MSASYAAFDGHLCGIFQAFCLLLFCMHTCISLNDAFSLCDFDLPVVVSFHLQIRWHYCLSLLFVLIAFKCGVLLFGKARLANNLKCHACLAELSLVYCIIKYCINYSMSLYQTISFLCKQCYHNKWILVSPSLFLT